MTVKYYCDMCLDVADFRVGSKESCKDHLLETLEVILTNSVPETRDIGVLVRWV